MEGWVDRWMDGQTDGWVDRRTDGWVDGQMRAACRVHPFPSEPSSLLYFPALPKPTPAQCPDPPLFSRGCSWDLPPPRPATTQHGDTGSTRSLHPALRPQQQSQACCVAATQRAGIRLLLSSVCFPVVSPLCCPPQPVLCQPSGREHGRGWLSAVHGQGAVPCALRAAPCPCRG